jgi:hypothetical protein
MAQLHLARTGFNMFLSNLKIRNVQEKNRELQKLQRAEAMKVWTSLQPHERHVLPYWIH